MEIEIALEAIFILALVISVIGVLVLAYAAVSTEPERASKARTKQFQKKLEELGWKGTITWTITQYSKSGYLASSSYRPQKDDTYPINSGPPPLDSLPFPFFWRTRTLVIIGSVFSSAGLILGAVEHIV
jgi:hypothetical protein